MSAALHGITKRFGAFTALDQVSAEIRDGEIHALLGANGSGKSTLVRTVTGVYRPDAGRIDIEGRDVTSGWSPAAASAAGVRVVHQEAPLADRLPIAESVALFTGYPRGKIGRIRWRRLHNATQSMLDDLGIRRRSRDLAAALTAAERAMLAVELALRGAGGGLRLLVLDEATAALPDSEAAPFLAHVRRVADRGHPVLMVTHRLAELEIADQVTVLDIGRVAISGSAEEVSRQDVLAVMRGGLPRPGAEAVPEPSPAPAAARVRTLMHAAGGTAAGPPGRGSGLALRVRGLEGREVRGLDLDVAAGEIVGVAGVRGSGLEELPRLITGAERRRRGSIEAAGKLLPPGLTPRMAIRHGVVFLSADRLHEGGVASLPVSENVILPEIGRFWHRPAAQRRAVTDVVRYLDVRPDDPSVLFGRLSGGNQQKAILGRLLRLRPRVLVLADPTNGVDPAAREVIFAALRDARANGVAVLMTSTEPEQMAGLCDRVLVLADGRLADEITGADMTVENLMARTL
jgi:ribose transport system ATP-binding protein